MTAAVVVEAREHLRATLAAHQDLPVLGHVPERIEPPCIIITERSPFIEPTGAIMGVSVLFNATVLEAPVADNETATRRLDEHVSAALNALYRHQGPATVGSYGTTTGPDGATYQSAVIEADINAVID